MSDDLDFDIELVDMPDELWESMIDKATDETFVVDESLVPDTYAEDVESDQNSWLLEDDSSSDDFSSEGETINDDDISLMDFGDESSDIVDF